MASAPPHSSSEAWTRWVCSITTRSGVQLAAFIFRPVRDEAMEPLPVLWTYNRYHTFQPNPAKLPAWSAQFPWLAEALAAVGDTAPAETGVSLDPLPWLKSLLANGYVVAIVDARGSGSSSGSRSDPFAPEEADDAYDVIEWLAHQPWCDGRVGMFGRSYMGTNQYFAAMTGSPHLKAIFPEMAMFDLYGTAYGGGIFRHDFARNWCSDVRWRDTRDSSHETDDALDTRAVAEARRQHQANRDAYESFARLPYRDSIDAETQEAVYTTRNPARCIEGIRRAGVAVYLLSGWYDPWVRDALLWFHNLDNPRRLVIGPWAHQGTLGIDLGEEHLRWFDHHIKGLDTGLADEAPLYYYTVGAPAGERWRGTWEWPPPEARPIHHYLKAGPTGSVRSVNDGLLESGAPEAEDGVDAYRVDFTTTSGRATRWTNGYGGPFGYPDLTANDERALTYTTRPLESDTELTGHPLVHLWVSATSKDADFFLYLEEVHADGYSEYVTEGALRASHRAICAPPHEMLGLPYHRGHAEDLCELTDEPVHLVIELHPLSRVFARGSRIRLTIACADCDNALTAREDPPPTVRLHRGGDCPSHLILPVVGAVPSEGAKAPPT